MVRFDLDKKVSNLRAREAMERAQLMFREHPLAPKRRTRRQRRFGPAACNASLSIRKAT